MIDDRETPTIASELKHFGVPFSFGELYNAGQTPYLKLSCLKHDDPESNLRVFMDQRLFHCFQCGWNGETHGLAKALKLARTEKPNRAA